MPNEPIYRYDVSVLLTASGLHGEMSAQGIIRDIKYRNPVFEGQEVGVPDKDTGEYVPIGIVKQVRHQGSNTADEGLSTLIIEENLSPSNFEDRAERVKQYFS